MSLYATHLKQDPGTMADVVIKEEPDDDCVEIPHVAIEAEIVDVEFEQPVQPAIELYDKVLRAPSVSLDMENVLKQECLVPLSEADIDQYVQNIKDELILEPECIQQPRIGSARHIDNLSHSKDCSVRIERSAAAEKALKEVMIQLFLRVNKHRCKTPDPNDLFCEDCGLEENSVFCGKCITKMRALTLIKKMRFKDTEPGDRMKTFRRSKQFYQEKYFKVVKKSPSSKVSDGCTARIAMDDKTVPVLLNTENILPKPDGQKKKSYRCQMCNKPTKWKSVQEKFCLECLTAQVVSNMTVTPKVIDKPSGFQFVKLLPPREPRHLITLKPNTKPGECYVSLERCEATEKAIRLKMAADSVSYKKKAFPVFWRNCEACNARTTGPKFCKQCENHKAKKILNSLLRKSDGVTRKSRVRTPARTNVFCGTGVRVVSCWDVPTIDLTD